MFAEAIANRAVGQYPLSIATSLAIESANGIHPEIIVDKPPILKYQELWVNVRTLFRNFMGSLDKIAVKGVTPAEISDALVLEMEQITSIIRDSSQGRCQVVYYVSNYADLESKYRHALIRRDNTDKQKEYTLIQTQTIEYLLKHVEPGKIMGFTLKLKPVQQAKALILTHYAYDLLSSKAFGELTLLESHTGAIKERAQWYTKYYDGKALTMIPFREDFIQVFGDAETFRPQPSSWKKELIDLATKYNWNAVTTRDKIVYGLDTIKDPYMRTIIKEMLVP